MTSGTVPHVRLHDLLLWQGFDVEDEVQAGPYRLDCYVRELHLGFEADGPHHGGLTRNRDAARDGWIWENLGIPVLRVAADELRLRDGPAVDSVRRFIEEHRWTVAERLARAERWGWW